MVSVQSSNFRRSAGFTLLELLAVALIIALLASLVVGLAGVAKTRAANSQARADIAVLSSALESFKEDRGYYPTTTEVRVSYTGIAEVSNNWMMVEALTGGGQSYYQPNAAQRLTMRGLTVMVDPWGRPYNYYNFRPQPAAVTVLEFPPAVAKQWKTERLTIGGQVNVVSYDLFSYGADGQTWGGHPDWAWSNGSGGGNGTYYHWNRAFANDDITNFK